MGTPALAETPARAAISRTFGPKGLERTALARGFPVATISAKTGCSARGKLRPRTRFPPESSMTGMTVSSVTRKKAARGRTSNGDANSVASLRPSLRIAISDFEWGLWTAFAGFAQPLHHSSRLDGSMDPTSLGWRFDGFSAIEAAVHSRVHRVGNFARGPRAFPAPKFTFGQRPP